MNIKVKFLQYTILIISLLSSSAFAKEVLTIITVDYNPPFEVKSGEGSFFGFEISLMKEICERIQTKCQFKSALYLDMDNMINAGQADLAIASIIITPKRRQKFLFSEPYKIAYLQYLVKKSTAIDDVSKLRNKTVAIYQNSPSHGLVLGQLGNNVQLLPFTNSMEMLNALKKNEATALITSYSQALYWQSNNSSYKLLGPKIKIGEGFGIMAKLGRDNLMKKINAALNEMENDGTYVKIFSQSF